MLGERAPGCMPDNLQDPCYYVVNSRGCILSFSPPTEILPEVPEVPVETVWGVLCGDARRRTRSAPLLHVA